MAHRILVAGVGNLGSRYLQGLKKVRHLLEVWAYDISAEALAAASHRWYETVAQDYHRIHFTSRLECLPAEFDIAIVACTADVRPQLVLALAERTNIWAWVLEKVLAQSVEGLAQLERAISPETPAWVNTPYAIFPLYSRLKEVIGGRAVSARFSNIVGVACNTIHFIDYVSRSSGSRIEAIDTLALNSWMRYPKRPSFQDVEGTLRVHLSDGSALTVTGRVDSVVGGKHISFRVGEADDSEIWTLNELEGQAVSSRGQKIYAPGTLLQSEMTASVVEQLLTGGRLDLPTLRESLSQHGPLLDSLISHWNQTMKSEVLSVPIT